MAKKRKAEPYQKLGAIDFETKKPRAYIPEWIKAATPVSCQIQQEKQPVAAFSHYFSRSILDSLSDRGITHLFPVQALLIPELMDPFRHPLLKCLPPRDICVSAPTGSGKTLSYVLPILQVLTQSEWTGRRHAIRALIVLPVVDLAKQVYEVFRSFMVKDASDQSDTDRSSHQLKIGLLTGQHELDADIRSVYESIDDGRGMVAGVDIVVATPGRLLEHLTESGGAFDLSYLRFLVIDEADRLLSDYRIEWFKAVERAVYGHDTGNSKKLNWFFGEKRIITSSIAVRRHRPNVGNLRSLFDAGRYPLQKIFLSATLSYDPGQLQRLNLFRPKLFKAQSHSRAGKSEESMADQPDQGAIDTDRVVLPSELVEYCLVCSSKSKPLAIYSLLRDHESDWKRVLCFVQSRETSRRLASLLASLGMENAKEASAALTRMRRFKLLKKFSLGKVRVLICSDLLARGIDIADVDCVINYDPPGQMLAYVHRAGRTARAGCPGAVVTMADEKEIGAFKTLMQTGKRWSTISQLELPKEKLKELMPKYRDALAQLKDVVQTQKRTVRQRRFKKRPNQGDRSNQRTKKARIS